MENSGTDQVPTAAAWAQLQEQYTKEGQEHVFKFKHTLSSSEQDHLFRQLSSFDPAAINKLASNALKPSTTEPEVTTLEPLPDVATASILDSDPQDVQRWYQHGLDLIAKNKVAVVLMAGGQGTRLGSSAPKGCYDIGLPSHKSLYQIQAERIVKLQQLAQAKAGTGSAVKVAIPWYVMTSGPTRGPTEAFFKDNSFFGLAPENVIVFEQGVLPCISNDGKMMLETPGKLAVAPDGNGGIYQALIVSGVLKDMSQRGIEHVHSYCVDNCLVRVADPVFTGFAASKDVDIATKVVRKRSPTESVGLIVLKNGKPGVVEYSEIDPDMTQEESPLQPGLLRFRAANIVNHYYSMRFLATIPRWASDLPHHVARKKIPTIDLATGEVVKPQKANGIKLEQFVFDVFPFVPLRAFACLEVRREDEFSALKNAAGTGEDDPDTSRRDILAQGRRWLEAAGAVITGANCHEGVEVPPSVSYAGEGFEHFKGQEVVAPALVVLVKG